MLILDVRPGLTLFLTHAVGERKCFLSSKVTPTAQMLFKSHVDVTQNHFFSSTARVKKSVN